MYDCWGILTFHAHVPLKNAKKDEVTHQEFKAKNEERKGLIIWSKRGREKLHLYLCGPIVLTILTSGYSVVFSPEYSSIPRVAHHFLMVDKFTDTNGLDRVYGPETYLMHLTDRC